jgi:hypothetical protein
MKINNNLRNIKKILLSSSENGWNSKRIDYSTLKELLLTDYYEAYRLAMDNIVIYRGDKSFYEKDIYYINPGIRKSQNSKYNLYTTLFSEILPSWSKYPKRNHSVICTTLPATASDYGHGVAFLILPKNGTELGICPAPDIWGSFKQSSIEVLSWFEKMYYKLLRICGYSDTSNGFKDIKEILNSFEFLKNHEITEEESSIFINDISFTDSDVILATDLVRNNKNLLEFFDKILLNPNQNNFKLIKLKDLESHYKENEIWFDNEYLAIEYYNFWELINNDQEFYKKYVRKKFNLNETE